MVSEGERAEVLGVGQATVSRPIDQIAPVVRQCIPIPAKIHDRAKRASTLEELEEILPGLRCLIDASEQQAQRPKRKDMEKSHYSGKAGRHTAKVRYTVNTNGLIVHNTGHSPGRVHDVRVYKMKHPTLPSGLSSRDGSDGKGEKARVRVYTDGGYSMAQKMYEEVEVMEPIRRKPGKKLSTLEKEFNRLHSKIRVYVEHAIRRVKTWRIMGGVPEPAEEIRSNQRRHLWIGKSKVAVAGRTSSLTGKDQKNQAGRHEK